MKFTFTLLAFVIILIPVASIHAGDAATPPSFRCPFDSFNTWRITAAYDLDRSTGSLADWTGWVDGDPTAGSGHAYDNHSGTDWGLPTGTDLLAIANGYVTALRDGVPNDDHSDTGNYIIMNHTGIGGRNWTSNCWHLAQNSLVPTAINDPVVKGNKIAESNNTGNSTGPHLHFGLACTSGGGTGNYTCPLYHGWFEDDEFYYGDTRICLRYMKVAADPVLNCRAGTSTSYDIITQLSKDQVYVACQHNGWYRLFLPMPPAKPFESRTSAGASATGYSESGTWQNGVEKSSVTDPAGDANFVTLAGSGSRYSTFSGTGGSDVATFTWTVPQKGAYEIFATWPSAANAANVTWRITHAGGTTDVTKSQTGLAASGGSGTHASPYIIDRIPYTASHTTIGAETVWNTYSPEGSGLPEYGPEKIYKLEIFETADITVSVNHAGYPSKDVDIHLLGSMSNTNCLARADWTVTYAAAAPGTYYIAIDSYGNNSDAATGYTIDVSLSSTSAHPNAWVSLGEYGFNRGATASVQIREDTVTGRVDAGRDGRVYADAIKVVPKITYRTGWASDTLLTHVPGADLQAQRMGCVGIMVDQTAGNDSRNISEYSEVPIHASKGSGTTNTSVIVGKAVTGQRFVSDKKEDGWYRVFLSSGCDASQGWINGDLLFAYREPWIVPAELSVFGLE